MIISNKKILELNEKYKIIENLSERDLKNPEGVGFDLRVKEVYKIKGKGYLGVEYRKTPEIELIAEYGKDKSVILKPGDYVLVKTIEKVNLPPYEIEIDGKKVLLMAAIYPRTTLFRCGVLLLCSKVDPGYYGELTFALKNLSDCEFELELGARIANIVFFAVEGGLVRPYEGQWKGGRVGTPELEKQI